MSYLRLSSPDRPVLLLASISVLCTMGCTASISADTRSLGNVTQPATGLRLLSRAEAPTLATVKPPGNPKINHHFISEKQLALLPVPRQSPELAKALAELQSGTLEERKMRLKAKVISDMVYVRGGSFMRGDFAKLMGIEGGLRPQPASRSHSTLIFLRPALTQHHRRTHRQLTQTKDDPIACRP